MNDDSPTIRYATTVDGLNIAYWVWGEAGPVVLWLPNLLIVALSIQQIRSAQLGRPA